MASTTEFSKKLDTAGHTAEVSRKVARVAVTDAISRLSHLEDLLIWSKPFDVNKWDAAETLLAEALCEVRKGRNAAVLVAAQKQAQAARDRQADSDMDRMGMGEVHSFLKPALDQVQPKDMDQSE